MLKFVKRFDISCEVWAWLINPLLLWWSANVLIKFFNLKIPLLTYDVALAMIVLFTVVQFLVCESIKVIRGMLMAVDDRYIKDANGDLRVKGEGSK